MLAFVDGVEIPDTEVFTIREINNTREKLNEMVDYINRLYQLQSIKESRDLKNIEMMKKFEQLEKDGYNVTELSLRELGSLMGDIHPQTVKNYLIRYMREELSKLKDNK